ncbi:MAG: carboxypeptidase-like regulatory domain-containing protein [Imperialibacter sp.]|uniref:carboxypeptidase-like regulatory domain-containing protein n=1 Tax=Imperialibacter sp. TaxID=2038411 RepID=UPI0032EC1CEE
MKSHRFHFLFSILLLGYCCTVSAQSQKSVLDRVIDVQVWEVNLDSAIIRVSEVSGIFFSYNADIVPVKQKFTLAESNKSVKYVLSKLLTGTGLEYKLIGDQVIIFKPQVTVEEAKFKEHVMLFGTVTDDATGLPIEGVNVFVAKSMLGDGTDQNGFFSIDHLPLGTYEVTFSHVAYQLGVKKINIQDTTDIALRIALISKLGQLESIEVISTRDKSWERHLRAFQTAFLGSTPNASRCVITNDHVLDFQYYGNDDLLIGYASEPLIIENWALGYRIYYVLELFEQRGGTTRYVGKSRFEELTPSDEGELKRWNKNRLRAYRGSLEHFIRSLTANRLRKEGFLVYKVYDLPTSDPVPFYEVTINSILKNGSHSYEKKLSFKDYLQVMYLRETEPMSYLEEKQKLLSNNLASPAGLNYRMAGESGGSRQVSYLQLNIPTVSVDRRGFIYDPLAVTTLGYWSWERLAESLPIEYEPETRPRK